MTDQAGAGVRARRTRRQLLAGWTGAQAAVLTAEALVRPAPAAANGDNVILGQGNAETASTTITNSTDGGIALAGTATGSGTGLLGNTGSGRAVAGFAVGGGTGVYGQTSALKPTLVTLALFPGAGHVESWNIDQARYTSLLETFLSPIAPS
jgi:hypothetical protein